VRKDDNESPKKILWTNPGGQRERGRPKSRWIDGVEEDARQFLQIGGRMPRIEVAGDICLKSPRPTLGCRSDDDLDLGGRFTAQFPSYILLRHIKLFGQP
jgi:hypothetical protein